MNTLQKAAQQALEALESGALLCELTAASMLRVALEAEQAQAVEPVATVQCINGVTIGYLDVMQPVGTKLYLHPAPSSTGKRAELIAELRLACIDGTLHAKLVNKSADMLEADAQAMSNLLARIHRDGGHYESEHGQIKAVDDADLIVAKLNALSDAQQVAVPLPMTEAQIFACDPVPHVMFDQQRIDFARAIEAFHGIGVKS